MSTLGAADADGVPDDEHAGPPADRSRRTLGLTAVVLAVAALALWGSSRGTWVSATWSDPLRGTVVATASGAETEPVLVPWALLALAAIAGVLATSGWGRRLVGVVVALAGLVAVWRAGAGFVAPEPAALPAAARRPGTVAGVESAVGWPLLAAFGAVLMLTAGAVVTWRAGTLPRLGARYEAPRLGATAASTPAAATTGDPAPPVRVDADRQLWDALDEGRDPTDTGEAPPTTDPSGRRGGRP